jgi:hypothetical protein
MLYHCMANLTIYLLEVSNSRCFDRHLRYPGKLRGTIVPSSAHKVTLFIRETTVSYPSNMLESEVELERNILAGPAPRR